MKHRTLDFGILKVGICAGLFWFRIFGKGLHIKDPILHPPLFSERNGFFAYITILGYRVRLLK